MESMWFFGVRHNWILIPVLLFIHCISFRELTDLSNHNFVTCKTGMSHLPSKVDVRMKCKEYEQCSQHGTCPKLSTSISVNDAVDIYLYSWQWNTFAFCLVVQNTGIPCFITLHFIALCRYCELYKLKVCGNPASSKSIGAIFKSSICLLGMSVSDFGNSHNISNFFIIVIFVMWSVISDLWCYYYDLLTAQMMVSIF